jgi:hypothetical protein
MVWCAPRRGEHLGGVRGRAMSAMSGWARLISAIMWKAGQISFQCLRALVAATK